MTDRILEFAGSFVTHQWLALQNKGRLPAAGGDVAPAVLPEAILRFDAGGRALSAPQAARPERGGA